MADHNRGGKRTSVLAVTLAIGACTLAISAWALEPAEEGSAVAYSTNDLGMQFVSVSAGQVPMGCSEGAKPVECSADEKPRHTVQITRAFEIGKAEVTQEQWQAVMGTDPSRFKGDALPVEQVSFQDAQAFLNKLNARNDGFNYRLPTEAEWEYAARAGTADQFAGANVADSLARRSPADDWAWYNVEKTQPVATKKPNAWGLYDMRGNVAEWVQDWYDPMYYGSSPAADPKGPATGDARVVRGGSFHSYPWLTRVSIRTDFPEGYSLYDTGFRLVREKR
jgi:formylglycine-generating enzyme required for sulfatase activity